MIVGTKKTLIRGTFDRDGFAKVTEITNEMHSTKGWRILQTRHGRTRDRKLPIVTEAWFPTRPRRTLAESPEITEKAKLRHKWYRIEKAAAAFRASLPNENRLDVE